VARRDLLALLGGATVWPLTTRAQQQSATRVVGILQSFKPAGLLPSTEFRNGLSEAGFTEGQNTAFDARWTDRYDELPTLAAELVHRQVVVIVAWGHPSVVAAKVATATIPIVFWTGADPVAQGLVAGLARPGGNLTGFADLSTALGAKRLELMHELLPKAATFGLLVNPSNPGTGAQTRDIQDAGRAMAVQIIHVVGASTENEIETALAALVNKGVDALIVAADPFIYDHREQVVAL